MFLLHDYIILFTYIAPPQFITHPMDTTVEINNESTTVVLTCMADKALSYYWERYNNNDDPSNTKLVGNSSERLVLPNVLPSNSGHYRCVADNMYGKSYSNNATLFIKGKTHKLML